MRNRGIDARVYYPYLLHEIRESEHMPTPRADRFRREVFSVPVHPFLREDEIEFVVDTLTDLVTSGKIIT